MPTYLKTWALSLIPYNEGSKKKNTLEQGKYFKKIYHLKSLNISLLISNYFGNITQRITLNTKINKQTNPFLVHNLHTSIRLKWRHPKAHYYLGTTGQGSHLKSYNRGLKGQNYKATGLQFGVTRQETKCMHRH